MRRVRALVLAAGAALAVGPGAMAQEAMYTAAATMPSPGVSLVRAQVHWFRYGTGDEGRIESTQEVETMLGIQYGLARDWSISLDVPLVWRRDELTAGGTDHDRGVADLDVMAKHRIYQKDGTGVDTLRIALLGGALIASGDDADFSSQSVNPHLGIVGTIIRGRHGGNLELSYQFNTGGSTDHNFGGGGPDDVLYTNAAYVFRLAPSAFTSESTGAWYAVGEVMGIWETSGDDEIRASLGIMYEGRRFGAEAMVLLPVYDDLDERAELDLGVGFGVRYLF